MAPLVGSPSPPARGLMHVGADMPAWLPWARPAPAWPGGVCPWACLGRGAGSRWPGTRPDTRRPTALPVASHHGKPPAVQGFCLIGTLFRAHHVGNQSKAEKGPSHTRPPRCLDATETISGDSRESCCSSAGSKRQAPVALPCTHPGLHRPNPGHQRCARERDPGESQTRR